MSSEVLTYTVTAGQTTVAGSGRIFNLLQAPGGPVSITADTRSQAGGQSPQRVFTNIPPGSKFTAAAGERWTYLRITSAVTQVITIFVGDEDMQFNNAVSITGTATTLVQPSATITDTAAISPTVTGQHALFAANPARRRITVYSDPANAGDAVIFFRKTAGANNVGFISPGTFQEFDTTAGLDYQCTNGGDKLYVLEES
jgi:hypothetical protein